MWSEVYENLHHNDRHDFYAPGRYGDIDRDAAALSSTSTVRGWDILPITVG